MLDLAETPKLQTDLVRKSLTRRDGSDLIAKFQTFGC